MREAHLWSRWPRRGPGWKPAAATAPWPLQRWGASGLSGKGAAYAFVSLFPIKILKVVFYDSVGLREARDFPTPSKFSGFLA